VDADARQFGGKQNFIFSVPTSCPKNVSAPLTVPIADALHCYDFAPVFTFLGPSAGYPRYATAGSERKDKKKDCVIKFCPPNSFDSFAPLITIILFLTCSITVTGVNYEMK